MDFGLIVKLGLAALTCVFAVFAIVNEIRSKDIDRDDGPCLRRMAKIGMWSSIVSGVLALAITGVDGLLPRGDQRIDTAQNTAASDPGAGSPDVVASKKVSGTQPRVQASAPNISANFASNMGPASPPPTFQDGMSNPQLGLQAQRTYQPSGGGSGYTWDSPAEPRRHDRDDHDRDHRPPKIVFPYTPVTFTVVLRFSTDDPTIKSFVNRVLRQAERESGIPLTSSSDKFASLRITPSEEIVYADGKQSRLNKAQGYLARKDEEAARRYLFEPQVHVTLAQESGARATFARSVAWGAIKKEQGTDMLDIYVFPKRKRLVLTVTANCLPAQGQFPDGAPSVYDLRGGTVTVQLERAGDLAGPKVVDLDDVDRHCADESMRLEASLAPRVRPTIVSILCATSPAGSIELGTDDSTIQRSPLDRETSEVCGPVALIGFPDDRPASAGR